MRAPDLSWFSRAGRHPFSGKKVKTPTLPNAGRVGHPENLNQTLRVHALQPKGWPPARPGWSFEFTGAEIRLGYFQTGVPRRKAPAKRFPYLRPDVRSSLRAYVLVDRFLPGLHNGEEYWSMPASQTGIFYRAPYECGHKVPGCISTELQGRCRKRGAPSGMADSCREKSLEDA